MKGHHLKDTLIGFYTAYLSIVKVRKAVFNSCGRSWESHSMGCSHLCTPAAHHHHWHNSLQHSHHSELLTSSALPSFCHSTHLGLFLWYLDINILILSHMAHSLEFVNQGARSFFHQVQLSEFCIQLLGHTLPSLLPSHRHSFKFPSLFAPGISSSWRLGMLSSLLHHFSLAMAPHLSPDTEGTAIYFQTHLPSSHPDKVSRTWKTNIIQRAGMLTLPAQKWLCGSCSLFTIQSQSACYICQYNMAFTHFPFPKPSFY